MTRPLGLSHILRRAVMPMAIAAGVILLAGCGGGGTTGSAAGPTTSHGVPAAAGVVITLTGTEYSFGPSKLKAAVGRTTIRFANKGVVEHDFTIDALGVKLAAKPGKSAEATVTLTPGTYQSYCSVPGHRQSGMQGTLTVS